MSLPNLKVDPKVKDILKLLAAGAILSSTILLPGTVLIAGVAIKEYGKYQEKRQQAEWNKYNTWRLRQVLKRLEKQKMVVISGNSVEITKKGKTRLLEYDLLDMKLKEKPDGKWRIIIYDVAELGKQQRDAFRGMLKRLKFLQIQKSVYITPFPCYEEIEYIRQRFRLSSEVKMIVATGLEEAEAYNEYFGI